MSVNGCNLQCFGRNDSGRDYVVGDVHGCFELLAALLTHIDFERQCDRLFALGDLIDRGARSADVGAWLAQPWLHSIGGNHEAMLLDATGADGMPAQSGREASLWRLNGGDWFFQLPPVQQAAIHRQVSRLALGFEVALPDGAVAALVHADVLADSWPLTRAFLRAGTGVDDADAARMQLLWSRARAQAAARAFETTRVDVRAVDVSGVDMVCFGHTPLRAPLALGNTRWLDTGAVHGGRLSIAELSPGGHAWALSADARVPEMGWSTPA